MSVICCLCFAAFGYFITMNSNSMPDMSHAQSVSAQELPVSAVLPIDFQLSRLQRLEPSRDTVYIPDTTNREFVVIAKKVTNKKRVVVPKYIYKQDTIRKTVYCIAIPIRDGDYPDGDKKYMHYEVDSATYVSTKSQI